MEAYFNELSLNSDSINPYKEGQDLAEIYRFLKKNEISVCRISADDKRQVYNFLREKDRNAANLILGFFQQPYENEPLLSREEQYYNSTYSFKGKECQGLAYAYITDSFTISISVNPWNDSIISIEKDTADVKVHNIADEENEPDLQQWFDNIFPVKLIKTNISPYQKKITLRDDHGKDELLIFAKKIVESPYVTGVINSMPFNPRHRRFILGCYPDGIIRIVLPWTDEGLGIVISTTGRNMRETEAISEILREEYCKK